MDSLLKDLVMRDTHILWMTMNHSRVKKRIMKIKPLKVLMRVVRVRMKKKGVVVLSVNDPT